MGSCKTPVIQDITIGDEGKTVYRTMTQTEADLVALQRYEEALRQERLELDNYKKMLLEQQSAAIDNSGSKCTTTATNAANNSG